jgi:4-amino-4-deoxy-L-arabinose transferase-like glycosyltransferase
LLPSVNPTDVSFVTAILAVGGYIYYLDLGSYTLGGWDEGVYATAAYHALEDGYWIVPHTYWMANNQNVALEPFLHKPPLVVWSQAVSMAVFGVNTLGARVPSATAAVATGVLVYFLGRWLRSRLTGLLAAVVWYTAPGVAAANNGGRFAATDTTLVLFGSAFVVLAFIALTEDRPALLVPTCLAAALAVMAKGFGAGIFLLVLAPVVVRRWRTLLSREMAVGVLGFALVVLPWPVLVTVTYGESFLQQALVEQVVNRATGAEGVSTETGVFGFMKYPFFRGFVSLFDPWVYYLVPGIGVLGYLTARRRHRYSFSVVGFLTWWAGVVLFFYAVFGNHQWYIMPMYVPAAVLVGWFFEEVAAWTRAALVGLAVGTVSLLFFSRRLAEVSPLPSPGTPMRVLSVSATGTDFLVVLVAFVALVLSVRLIRSGRLRFPAHDRTLLVAPALVGLVLVGAFTAPWASVPTLVHNQAELGTTVDERVPEGETVYVGTHVTDASNLFPYEFYSRRPAATASKTDLYTDPSVRYALIEWDTLSNLRRPHEVLSKTQVQTGPGSRGVALVNFTGGFEEYDPTPRTHSAPNLLDNPWFDRGVDGWWTPDPDRSDVTVVTTDRVDGRTGAVLTVPAGGKRLPLAQSTPVEPGRRYDVEASVTGDVDVVLVQYDGPARPENVVDRWRVPASELPTTVTATGTNLSVRFKPVDDRAVVHYAAVRRSWVLPDDEGIVAGENLLRNGDFENALDAWWANGAGRGTTVTATDGRVRMTTPPGQEALPVAQQVVVDRNATYLVDVRASGDVDVLLVWFANASADDPVATDTVPVGGTPTTVDAKAPVVAVRVLPDAESVTVDSVELYRVTAVDVDVDGAVSTPENASTGGTD